MNALALTVCSKVQHLPLHYYTCAIAVAPPLTRLLCAHLAQRFGLASDGVLEARISELAAALAECGVEGRGLEVLMRVLK